MHVTLDGDRVSFGNRFFVRFERTLRIPDDGRTYPLPPSFGPFPVRRVDDHLDRVPAAWRAHGGVFLPMHAREAMWLSFHGQPTALKIGVGKVCAITGDTFSSALSSTQDYLVAPNQPWIDGVCVKKGVIRQFVGVPLGLGATVEGQITGEERVGGVQLVAFAPRPGFVQPGPDRGTTLAGGAPFAVPSYAPPAPASMPMMPPGAPAPYCAPSPGAAPIGMAPAASATRSVARPPAVAREMGLGAGGTMGQIIYPDPYGLSVWDAENVGRCFVHLVSAEDFAAITGEPVPSSPVDAAAYAKAGFPFYVLDDHGAPALAGSEKLAKVKSVQSLVAPQSPSEDASIEPGAVKTLAKKLVSLVRDGSWLA